MFKDTWQGRPMARIMNLPAGGVVLTAEDARDLAAALFAAQDLAGRHGAHLKSNVLLIAAELSSIRGTTEPALPALEHSVVYEQIDADTAAHIMGCSPRNVRDLAARGRIPGIKRGGRWWFNADDVEVHRDYR